SYNHDPFLMLKGTNYLRGEIRHAREILARLGIITFAFRPPVGITSPRLWRPLLESGSHCVNFSRRAFDAGNRRLPGMADKLIRRIRPGDIILLHDVAPARGFDRDLWLAEVGRVIDVIREKGLEIAPLSKLTGRRVSVRIDAGDTIPAPSPLDLIATLTGDEGIWGSTYAGKERELFETNFLPLLGPTHRVLDIGTGGALSIGRRVGSVTVMVPSEGAASLLEEGARREGVDAIDIRTGGLESAERGGHYDAVTCLSSFEYTPVIEHLLAGLSPLLKPGGILYIITARRSCSGFIARARAAMRFGILPRTRSEGSISRALAAAGFRETRITIHHAGSPWASPHLLEVVARKW
ncbi:MAG: methyltransferase domain-containing protein, partial [Chrysiogenales bacterium]